MGQFPTPQCCASNTSFSETPLPEVFVGGKMQRKTKAPPTYSPDRLKLANMPGHLSITGEQTKCQLASLHSASLYAYLPYFHEILELPPCPRSLFSCSLNFNNSYLLRHSSMVNYKYLSLHIPPNKTPHNATVIQKPHSFTIKYDLVNFS